VLNLLTSALWTMEMSGFMFSEMFGVLERLATRVTTVLVSRHGTAPTQIPHVLARNDAPATSSVVVTHSSAGTARIRVSTTHVEPPPPLVRGSIEVLKPAWRYFRTHREQFA
jgi:hypothetical protein